MYCKLCKAQAIVVGRKSDLKCSLELKHNITSRNREGHSLGHYAPAFLCAVAKLFLWLKILSLYFKYMEIIFYVYVNMLRFIQNKEEPLEDGSLYAAF